MQTLADEAQRGALRDLERSLYAAEAGTFDSARVASALRNGFVFVPSSRTRSTPVLPPLYPFEVRKRA